MSFPTSVQPVSVNHKDAISDPNLQIPRNGARRSYPGIGSDSGSIESMEDREEDFSDVESEGGLSDASNDDTETKKTKASKSLTQTDKTQDLASTKKLSNKTNESSDKKAQTSEKKSFFETIRSACMSFLNKIWEFVTCRVCRSKKEEKPEEGLELVKFRDILKGSPGKPVEGKGALNAFKLLSEDVQKEVAIKLGYSSIKKVEKLIEKTPVKALKAVEILIEKEKHNKQLKELRNFVKLLKNEVDPISLEDLKLNFKKLSEDSQGALANLIGRKLTLNKIKPTEADYITAGKDLIEQTKNKQLPIKMLGVAAEEIKALKAVLKDN